MTTNRIKLFSIISSVALMFSLLAVPTTHAQQSAVAGKALGYRVKNKVAEAAVMNKDRTVFYGAMRVTETSGTKATKVEFVRPNNTRFDSVDAEDLAIGTLVIKNAPIAVSGGATSVEDGFKTIERILNKAK